MLILACVHFGLLANTTKVIVDDRQKHAHAHEHHHQNEHAECERAEKRSCFTQPLSIELHQHHLEQHLRGVQQAGARPQVAHEQQVEQHEEGDEHDREHRRERQQILGGTLECSNEEHQPMVETTQTNELERGKETGEGQQIREQIIDIDRQLQIHSGVSIGFGKQLADTIHLSVAPNTDAHTGPGTHDDTNVHVRPELTKVGTLQFDQRLDFHKHHVESEEQVEDARNQVRERCES